MTVNTLLNHFEAFPRSICFIDEKYGIEDRVHFYKEDEFELARPGWEVFLDEYGERTVMGWYYYRKDILDILIR